MACKVESENIGKAAPKPDFLDEAEQGDGRLKEEGEAQSGASDEVEIFWGFLKGCVRLRAQIKTHTHTGAHAHALSHPDILVQRADGRRVCFQLSPICCVWFCGR